MLAESLCLLVYSELSKFIPNFQSFWFKVWWLTWSPNGCTHSQGRSNHAGPGQFLRCKRREVSSKRPLEMVDLIWFSGIQWDLVEFHGNIIGESNMASWEICDLNWKFRAGKINVYNYKCKIFQQAMFDYQSVHGKWGSGIAGHFKFSNGGWRLNFVCLFKCQCVSVCKCGFEGINLVKMRNPTFGEESNISTFHFWDTSLSFKQVYLNQANSRRIHHDWLWRCNKNYCSISPWSRLAYFKAIWLQGHMLWWFWLRFHKKSWWTTFPSL